MSIFEDLGRPNNFNMFYLFQNIFSTERQSVRENSIVFIEFKKEVRY